jgi:hypothetical protein
MTSDSDRHSVERPGPVYDNAWRLLFAGRAGAVAAYVTGQPASAFADAKYSPTELPGTTLGVDALIETAERRLHIELQLRANASEFEPRLVNYWARLNTPNTPPLEQHVIVLNPQGGRLSGTYRRAGLRLDYHVHHLWDERAEAFLAHPTLYPLAVLAQARSASDRVAILQNIIDQADANAEPTPNKRASDGTDRAAVARTVSIAATLASIYLPRSTIKSILERNNTMAVLLRDFPFNQWLIEDGRAEGREEARQEARQEALAVLLTFTKARHGELSDQLTAALSSSPKTLKELSELVLRAANSAELEQLLS